MPLKVPRRDLLKDALAYRHDEPFEKALSRAIRSHGGEYADFVELIGLVRERARSRKLDLREAARELGDQP